MKTVQNNREKLEAQKQAAVEEEKAKIVAKIKRKQEKEAARKAVEREQLKEHILENFIKKATVVEGIVTQEIVDADGFGQKEKGVVSVLGGVLGQLMIVLNTIKKNYSRLDMEVKSGKSTTSRAKSVISNDEKEAHHKILNPLVIQKFIYDYVLERLKSEKLSIQVDPAYVNFLSKLPAPLAINEMRTIKEPNFSALRELLTKNCGG